MFQTKIRITLILVTVIILGGALFALLQLQMKPELIESKLIPHLEEITGGDIRYAEHQLHYFPSLYVSFEDLSFETRDSSQLSMRADDVRIYLNWFSAIFAKPEASKVLFKDASARWTSFAFDQARQIKVQNMNLAVSSVRQKAPMKIEAAGDLEGVEESFSLRGLLTVEQFDQWVWSSTGFNGEIHLKDFPIKKLAVRKGLFGDLELNEGLISADFEMHKMRGEPEMSLGGTAFAEQFVYEIRDGGKELFSPAMDLEFEYEVSWNPDNEDLGLKRISVKSPISNVEIAGNILLGTGEVQNMRVTAFDIAMEQVPHYLVQLKELIPFHLGFSGQSELEMSIEGTLDHLSLHANWDLTPTLLVYSRFFSKPKDLPLNVVFDYLIKDGQFLSGDFSMRLKNASIKGTLANLDMESGDGQLNIITNKFTLDTWKPLLLPLEGYEIEGDIKFLLNARGNLRKFQDTEQLLNMTLSNASIYRTGEMDRSISGIDVSLDFSPLALDLKNLKFEVNDSAVLGKLKIYNLSKNPILQAELNSEEFKVALFLEIVEELISKWLSDERRHTLHQIKSQVSYLFPKGYPMSDFRAVLKAEGKEWDFSQMAFNAYDGDVQLQATLNYDSHFPTYWLNLAVDKLSLAKFTGRGSTENRVMDGKLFLQGQFVGVGFEAQDWKKRVQGEGNLIVTNGEFYSFDLLGAIADINEFSELNLLISETTRFDDLHAKFSLKDEQFTSDDITLISPDLRVQGRGEYTFDNVLNYRLNVYLTSNVTSDVLAPLVKLAQMGGGREFGPVPLLLSGPLSHPDLKPDATLLAALLDDITRRKNQRALRNFLPEDSLFAVRDDRR